MDIFDRFTCENEEELDKFIKDLDCNLAVVLLIDAVIKANKSNVYSDQEKRILNRIYEVLSTFEEKDEEEK